MSGAAGAGGRPGPCASLLRAVSRALAAVPRPVAALAAAGWMAVVFRLSSGPIDLLPPHWISNVVSNAAHGPIFGVLALLAARAAEPSAAARAIGLAVALLYGAADEWHQSMVPGRTPALSDWITNAIGATGSLWLLAAPADERVARRRLLAVAALVLASASVATLLD